MYENIENKIENMKQLLNELIEKGELDYALDVIDKCENVIKNDVEIISMKGVIYYAKNEIEKAEEIFKRGLLIDSTYIDFYFNLGCIYELKKEYEKAAKFFARALEFASGKETIDIGKKLNNILCKISAPLNDEIKIAFFVKPGLDSFLNDIILGLMDEYFVRKIIVTDFKQIDEGMQWADVCWFEWCDEFVIYGSRHELAEEKKLICRLHSYEAFADYIFNVKWESIDKIIFVAKHIFEIVNNKLNNAISSKSVVIPNGINLDRYTFKERQKGFNIAYVGYINYKKGPMLLLQLFKSLYDKDKRYKLYIAGQFQDERYVLYFNQMIKEMGLENYVIFEGWQNDIDKWLEDKNYIVCCSILESQNISIMEAMAKGIKPVIHNFVGAKEIYPSYLIWNTIDEAVEMILSGDYDSTKYRAFIESNYSLEQQNNKIRNLIEELAAKQKDLRINAEFNNVWDSIWNNYSKINLSDIINEPSGMTLRSEFISLLNKFFILKNAKILEVGCSSGVISLDLSLRGTIYTGIDISYEAIRLAKLIASNYNIANCEYTYGNGFNLVYPDNSYDISFNIGVLEHFNDNDIVKMLSEMARVSKFVIVGVPYSGSQIYRLTKRISQSNNTWEYGFERDFKTLKYLTEKAGLHLLHEEVIGYVSEAYYLKRINPHGIQALIAENITKLFNKEKNIGNWLIAIMTKDEKYKNLFMSLNDEKKICFSNENVCIAKKLLPSVSIVIPFYNAQKYVNRIISNISQIEYTNLEFVFIDDGSTDSTKDLLKKLSKESEKEIKIISLERNKGTLYARFEGIKKSEGEYIFFHDIDDLMYYNGIIDIVNDLRNISDECYLATSCAYMREGEFTGEIGYHKILVNALDYVLEGIKNLSGLVSLINTLIPRELIVNIFQDVLNILDKGNISNMSVAEDTLIVDYMVLSNLVSRIIPIYYTLRGYEFRYDSLSKNVNKRIAQIPIQIACTVNMLIRKKYINKFELKDIEDEIRKNAIQIYGNELGKHFINNYEKYKDIFRKIIS